MSALRYLKLDYLLTRGMLKYYILFPIMFIYLLNRGSTLFAIGYLFFNLVYIAQYPFSFESKERSQTFYYMLPPKKSQMVLGRYLYLISAMISVWLCVGIAVIYLYQRNDVSTLELFITLLSGTVATIICFLQYPLFYKVGVEKGKLFMFFIPAMGIFALPLLLDNISAQEILKKGIESYPYYSTGFIALALIILIIIGFVSYSLSCFICRNKEI